MKKNSDENLYCLANKGEKRSFDVLYSRYAGPLLTFILRYIQHKEVAEEILQDVFVKIMTGARPNFSQGTFKGWIYKVARNKCLDKLKRIQLEEKYLGFSTKSDQKDLDHELDRMKLLSSLRQIANHLPQPLKNLFMLKKAGLTNKEISKATGLPLGTVKSRTHKMLAFIKVEMKNEKY